jgi:hypothetical protein
MSFNLGDWAKKLSCDMCAEDSGFDGELGDGDWPDPGDSDPDWGPESEEGEGGGVFDDFPTGIPLGEGMQLQPSWDDGPGLQFRWDFP